MNITRNGVTIQVADADIITIVFQHLAGSAAPADLRGISVPRIGQPWPGQGGIYAGIMRGRDGEPDYHLIVGQSIDETTWEKAKNTVASMESEGHRDFTLPFRAEQALQFANVPELFEKEWYWSREQRAENGDCAWGQSFGYGLQGCCRKSNEFRARAVRRLIIQ
ncbi:MAG: DUF1566 domain-containing protein [Planctomycetes bacterium]|nr:DUF1566 domain-containing protein [Planctomycetota bacterium]